MSVHFAKIVSKTYCLMSAQTAGVDFHSVLFDLNTIGKTIIIWVRAPQRLNRFIDPLMLLNMQHLVKNSEILPQKSDDT